MQPPYLELAASTEDAFDATVSALVMAEHVDELRHLPPIHDPTSLKEGLIWQPRRQNGESAGELKPVVESGGSPILSWLGR